jgi:RNA polymerase sigma-54 factor
MSIKLGIRMQQRVSPMLILTNKLLQLSALEFEQTIQEELTQNPALAIVHHPESYPAGSGISEYSFQCRTLSRSASSTRSPDQDSGNFAEQVPERPHGVNRLVAEAMLLVERCDQPVAAYLLHAMDSHGYLRTSPEELADELGVPVATVKRVIHILHELDPPGIAARDLRECLQIQCRCLEAGESAHLAQRIVSETWDDFIHQRWGRIAQMLEATHEEVEQARRLMCRHLYPYPLHLLEDNETIHNVIYYPDLIVTRKASVGSGFGLYIPAVDSIELRVSPDFEALSGRNCDAALSEAERMWVTKRVRHAQMFIKAVEQRWTTLQLIGEYLIDRQGAFLEGGPLHLQPLTRAEVAESLKLHESTVGRAVRDKIIQLLDGRLVPLSDFFDDSVVAKERIRQLLAHSKKPLNDREIADQLSAQGLHLARRTVTKYRRQLNIPTVYGRQSPASLSHL